MPMNLEVFSPRLTSVVASVSAKELGGATGFGNVDNPKIISPNSSYEITFSWNSTGSLFQVLQPGATWDLTVMLENLGGRPDVNLNKSVSIPHVMGSQTGSVVFSPTELRQVAGSVLKTIPKLHLTVNGVMIACAFDELQTIHVSEEI